MRQDGDFDALVVGAGPTGLAAAVALARTGLHVALAGLRVGGARRPSTRTAALLRPAITFLQNLGVWRALVPHCAPLEAIRIVDGTGFILRAPDVVFKSREIGWESFGYNVPDDALVAALERTLRESPVRLLDGGALTRLTVSADTCVAQLADGALVHARLIVAADGRESVCRAEAGIGVRRGSYEQSAVTTRFAHTRAHANISTEFHGTGGPCTTVPLPGRTSSLVWVERTAEADRLMGLDDDGFVRALSDKLGGLLGEISSPAPRGIFPLSWLAADRLGTSRVVLVGEAAHVIPPIGAQGLNLGLLDAAMLADCAAEAADAQEPPGSPPMIERYEKARRSDIERRMRAVDILNRSLTSNLLPVTLARGAGLHALAAMPALRRRIMSAGLMPQGRLPRLMRQDSGASLDRGA
jgi:2-octaprenyl-6-methoxyphenol hydroxylase